MRRNLVFFIPIFLLLAACTAPTPQATPQLVNVYASDAVYPWVSGFYDCAAGSAVINLSDPQAADISLRLSEPDHLSGPAYQLAVEEVLVIAHPQAGVDSLTLEQVKSLFLGQALNWKDVGGNDLPVQVWTYSPGEDILGIFSKAVLNGQPVTSLARLATSARDMLQSVGTNAGSVGLLTRRSLGGGVKDVYKVASAPVLAITKSQPEGAIRDLIGCLQDNH